MAIFDTLLNYIPLSIKYVADSPGTPVLLSYYTRGSTIIPITNGQIDDMHYTIFSTLGKVHDGLEVTEQAIVVRVELPFVSKLHLLGVPIQSGNTSFDPTGKAMEEVVLEGDYPSYFKLYADKGMQVEVRYALDPKAMAFTADFCRSHSWEIVNNDLYFLQTTSMLHEDDTTSMFSDIASFVEQIRPAVEKPLSPEEEKARTPYGVDRRDHLVCPVCSQVMRNEKRYFVCLNEHGVLVTGKILSGIPRSNIIRARGVVDSPQQRSHNLVCPSCQHQMDIVPYTGSTTAIDSCSNCPYRWIDSTDFVISQSNAYEQISKQS